MLLKAFNKALIRDREATYLTTAASAGDTSLTVADTDLAAAASSSNTWANNDYVLVGRIGEEKTEIVQMSAAVTSATSLTIDREGQSGGLRHDHPIGTPIYRIDFNQVEFYHNTTNSTSGVSTLTTISVQPDDLFTRYDDTSNSTGYGFIRFKNETSGVFSSYSSGVNYEEDGQSSSRDPRTLFNIRKRVRKLLDVHGEDEKLTDTDIDDSVNDAQRDIAHMRLWSFFENERSFSSVADQFAYTIPATVQKVHTVSFDTQPLLPMSRQMWDGLHWDQDVTSADPSHFSVWNGELKIYPRPSAAATATQLDGALTAAATTITVDSTSGFNRGDYYRLIINSEVIYATASTSTTFTGALRGREGTTAAAHSDNDAVTERDIVYTTHEEPVDLLDAMDRTVIPEPDAVAYMAAIDLAPAVSREDRIPHLEAKRDAKIKSMETKYGSKQTGVFTAVKDVSMVVPNSAQIINPNLFPKDITGS